MLSVLAFGHSGINHDIPRLSAKVSIFLIFAGSLLLWAAFWFLGVFVLTLAAALMS